MTDKPRITVVPEWQLDPPAVAKIRAVAEMASKRYCEVIELEPVLDLLERVVTTTSVDGCRTLQGDIEAILREHGRLK